MSDDEEILCNGTDLCTYLIDQGYADFETFRPPPSYNDEEYKTVTVKPIMPETHSKDFEKSIYISHNDYEKLCYILNCQLIFKEDIDILEAVMSKTIIQKPKSYLSWNTVLAAAGLLSTIVFYKKCIYLPIGMSALCSICFLWQGYNSFQEFHETNLLVSHVNLLQKCCSTVQKLLRYLKETEILSNKQIPIHSFGRALYSSVSVHDNNELDKLPSWITFPHLRKCLADSLLQTINTLSNACDFAKSILPTEMVLENTPVSIKESIKSINQDLSSRHHIITTDLQRMNDVYLVLQSEYLRWIAFILCSVFCGKQIKERKMKFSEIIVRMQTKMNEICFELEMQYNIHGISSVLVKSQKSRIMKKHSNKINNMQAEVHNIFLVILTILLRIKHLEDFLEKLPEDNSEMNPSVDEKVMKELVTLREDFTSAVKYYDTICQAVSQKKIYCDTKEDLITINSAEDNNYKKTGITVGSSDFTVNSPDEVFLAISGLNSEQNDNDLDDWDFERKPQIPKNLLAELSKTLTLRKKIFTEREKLALNKQGLQDIESESDDLSGDENINKHFSNCSEVKNKSKRAFLMESSNSDTADSRDDDNIKHRRQCHTNLKRYKKYIESENSSSDEEVIFQEDNTKVNPFGNSSLAHLIAAKSQLWKKPSEERYSDG